MRHSEVKRRLTKRSDYCREKPKIGKEHFYKDQKLQNEVLDKCNEFSTSMFMFNRCGYFNHIFIEIERRGISWDSFGH